MAVTTDIIHSEQLSFASVVLVQMKGKEELLQSHKVQ
jgi:hypothetical protein